MTPSLVLVHVMKNCHFFHCLNELHPSLTFSMDEEKDNKLPFLDVFVERRSFTFVYI